MAISIAEKRARKERIQQVRENSPWLSADEAAAYLSVAKSTLSLWRRQGMLPCYKPTPRNSTVLYNKEDLDAILKSSTFQRWFRAI